MPLVTTWTHVNRMAHTGDLVVGSYYYQTVADSASAGLVLKTGASPTHMCIECNTGGDGEISFYEGTTVSASTALTPYPFNRVKSSSFSGSLGRTITFDDTKGTRILWVGVAGEAGNKSIGGGPHECEWILRSGCTYALRVINRSGADAFISFEGHFYEG